MDICDMKRLYLYPLITACYSLWETSADLRSLKTWCQNFTAKSCTSSEQCVHAPLQSSSTCKRPHSRGGCSKWAQSIYLAVSLWFLSDPFQPVCRHIPHPVPSRSPTQSQFSHFTVFNHCVLFLKLVFSLDHSSVCALTSLSAQLWKAAPINHLPRVKHCAACEFSQHLRGEYSVMTSEVRLYELHAALWLLLQPPAQEAELLRDQAGSLAGLGSGQLLAATILKTFAISSVNCFHCNTSSFYAQGAGIH